MKRDLSPRIVIFGVGGAGSNAVKNMMEDMKRRGHDQVEFAISNTDAQALESSPCEKKIKLGPKITKGLGAGAIPEIGRKAAEESIDDVMEYLKDSNMVIIVAGMGGGTGTGAAPVIAEACKKEGILTLGVVIKPFLFEGSPRIMAAKEGIEKLKDQVDTFLVFDNQNLQRAESGNTPFLQAFSMPDKFLSECVSGIVSIIKSNGLINVDFADLCTVVRDRKSKAMMGIGNSVGENKGSSASSEAMFDNVLLDCSDMSWKNVDHILVCINGGEELSSEDVFQAVGKIHESISPNAKVIFGAAFDKSMGDSMRVFMFGTTTESKNLEEDLRSESSKKDNNEFKGVGEDISYMTEDESFIGSHHDLNDSESENSYEPSLKTSQNKKNKKGIWSRLSGFWSVEEDIKIEEEKSEDIPEFFKKKD
ncbi:cell division protein FtsZ [Candidatus Nesciobacter abundans]|uniref:cell division protein FtsZ n=1 Tax=Candidatus Nesciobacter abundans TaxID=2601668 RepID=UPI001653A69D|nr:cell division protein FtsZ [Candidatus Nesciobacter abundans]